MFANRKYRGCWMFFNCDAWNSTQSMNPSYNDTVYRNRDGRRALWRKVLKEREDGNIEISDVNMPIVHDIILEGEPEEASNYLTYGCILKMEEVA